MAKQICALTKNPGIGVLGHVTSTTGSLTSVRMRGCPLGTRSSWYSGRSASGLCSQDSAPAPTGDTGRGVQAPPSGPPPAPSTAPGRYIQGQ